MPVFCALFGFSVVLNAAAASPAADNCSGVAVPAPAAQVHYSKLAFCDDFNSIDTIDTTGSGQAGFKWYTNRPYGLGIVASRYYSVSGSVLSVTDQERFQSNRALQTMDPVTGNGQTFRFGYFEARIRFNPRLGRGNPGWPAVWLTSANRVLNPNKVTYYAELDIFEACPNPNNPGTYNFNGTVHDWRPGQDSTPSKANEVSFYSNRNHLQMTPNIDWNTWHVVAVLWTPGRITWYLDGRPLMSQGYSGRSRPDPLPAAAPEAANHDPQDAFRILDSEGPKGLELILGSGPDWPLYVDWIRVWN
jgi:beta-glucanase (GH16 family)